jgi:hypothetical protein
MSGKSSSLHRGAYLSGRLEEYETESQESDMESEMGFEYTPGNGSASNAEIGRGSIKEVKSLYNHAGESGHGSIWSENADLILEKDRLKALVAPYAIVQRFTKPRNKKDGPWEPAEIEIQSSRLKGFLDTVFDGYQGWNSETEPYVFRPPFKKIFHRWETLKLEYVQQPDESARDEIKLLIDILLPFMTPHATALEEIESTQTISFEKLWLIFQPGELVVTLVKGSLCVCKLREVYHQDDSRKDLNITLEQLDWNGRYCGFKYIHQNLEPFTDLRAVSKLSIHPLKFDPSKEEIHSRLLARGQQFAALRGFHVKKCVGDKFVSRRKGEKKPKVDGNPRPVSS